ncbi:MAG: dephospho-CoA kinase, partial [Chloroflexi bacterium]|nr:dephospho-CoA kinase [Chloroflexota bacterium]
EARERLNAIVHPRMYAMVEERIRRLREQGATAVVLDAAILIEAGWDTLVDEVWVVAAAEETVVQRIGQRNGLPAEQVRQRIRAQITVEERARHAAVVIDNSEGLDELSAQVREVWTGRVKGSGK